MTEVTYLGSAYAIQTALGRMRKRDRGTILQVGSALAYRSIPLQSAYCGAKHAVQVFIDSLRSELSMLSKIRAANIGWAGRRCWRSWATSWRRASSTVISQPPRLMDN